jgi:surface polysaccharide O-acyltransferase-like enzyme
MQDQIIKEHKRIESLDVLRGMALILIILFHSSIYNFANIHKLDFSNPPVIVILMSFMALWGGIFIIYSMVINTIMLLGRSREVVDKKVFIYPIIAGFIYLFLHYILNIFLGRWNTDFVNNKPDLTVVAGSLRDMHFTFPHIAKFFEGSSLSTIAFNLIILSFILYLILRKNGIEKETRNYLILGISGTLIMILSFVRVPLFHLFTQALEHKNYLVAAFFSFTIANPYPLLPYLAYGFFGIMIGVMIYLKRHKLLKIVIMPLGFFFLFFGLSGMMNFEKSISAPDYFWYSKTNFELGVFLLIFAFIIPGSKPESKAFHSLTIVKWFSRVSLTIYLLETFTSEILRIICLSIQPSWNQTINGCLLFGGLNIILWIILLFFWSKVNFKFSLEYFWVRFFNRIGKISTKMEHIP